MTETKQAETIRRPMKTGHCNTPSVYKGESSHARCDRQGGGQRANPQKEFQPCSCQCHYGTTFECGGCGYPIREAPLWPLDEDGDMRYTHVDHAGNATGEDCHRTPKVSRNEEADPEPEAEPEDDDLAEFDDLLDIDEEEA